MKKLLYIILLLPLWVNAQNVTMNKTNGYLRTLVSGTAVDSVMMSFGTGVNGYIPIYNSTLKKNVYTNPNTIIPTQYWQRSGTTLSPLTSGDNISTTGNIIGAAGSFASLSSVASNGISGSFTNNSTGFATIKATNSGSGNLAEFSNSGGVVATITNGGGINSATLGNGLVKSTSGLLSNAVAGTDYLTPTGSGSGLSGVVLTSTNQNVAGVKTFTDSLLSVRVGSNKFKVQGTGASQNAYVDIHRGDRIGNAYVRYFTKNDASFKWQSGVTGNTKFYIQNATTGSVQDALEIDTLNTVTIVGNFVSTKATGSNTFGSTISSTPQGTLYGTASGSITSAQLATSLTDETGTGSAVFSASPTFTGTLTGTSATFTGTLVQQNITDGTNLFGQNTQEGTRRANLFSTNSYTAFQTVGATPLQLGTNGVDRYTIDASGLMRFHAYGAGTLTTDASGNITATSDERKKNISNFYTSGLSRLSNIKPITYKWKASTKLDTANNYTGFSAQNIQANIPEAVGKMANGNLTIQDRPIMATMVNAINELNAIVEAEKKVSEIRFNLLLKQQSIIDSLEARIKVLESKP